MGIKIENSTKHTSGYDIRIAGIRRTFHARNGQEIVYALSHYFGKTIIPEAPYDKHEHDKHAKECDCCPLCRK
jgi:hypothetical protein